jgi:membrane-bound lytic murein transglycosylase D
VGRQVSLNLLAAEAGIDPQLLRQGNMELIYGLTPSDSSYRLKVPARTIPLIVSVLEREDQKLLTHYRYVIKYGDTLSALARHYDVSLKLIEESNPGITGRYLKIGETIIIPALKETVPYAGKSGPSIEGSNVLAFTGTHLVKKGETLWSLALAYSVDPELLAEANGMELNQTLPEGKTLKVPIIE